MKHATRYVQVLFANRITWGRNQTNLYANMTTQEEKLAQWADMCEEQVLNSQKICFMVDWEVYEKQAKSLIDDIMLDFIKSLDDTCKWSLLNMLEDHLYSEDSGDTKAFRQVSVPWIPSFDLAKYRFMR